MRIAVLFDNFGPYHIARLARLNTYCEVLGIEVAERSAEYAWEPTTSVPGFQRCVLLKGATSCNAERGSLSRALAQALATFQPDVTAIPGWSSAPACLARRWCRRNVVPTVLMSESQAVDQPRYRLKEFVKRCYVTSCQSALVGGRSHKAYLVDLGMPEERIFLGYDAVDNDYFSSVARKVRENVAAHRARLHLPTRFFLASSRFVPKKNLLTLIRAYARYRQLSSELPVSEFGEYNWDLVLLGDGPLRGQIEQSVVDLGLARCVHLPGFLQYADIPVYYALASAFVHASTTEQWGLVVNEAMASGLPVLVSDRCGCAMELVDEGRNGFCFDPTDGERLAHLMAKLSASTVLTEKMGTESSRLIARWGTDQFARGMILAAEYALSAGARRIPLLGRFAGAMLLSR